MRILLINPGSKSVFHTLGLTFPPLGLLYIAAAARKAGHSVHVHDQLVDSHPIVFHGYDIVGIYCDTTRFHEAMRCAAQAKKAGGRVVMGGPHPCFDSDVIFDTGWVDAIVRGEGEQSFVQLLTAWQSGKSTRPIPGCLVKSGTKIIDGGSAKAISNVDDLLFPARDLVNLRRYDRARLCGRALTSMHTSRGCPHQCRFCASSQLEGASWRARSAASVLAELEHLVTDLGYSAVAFLDDNFAGSATRIHLICDGILEKGWDLRWWCFCRVDTILRHPDMIAKMARAGCHSIFVGVESPSIKNLVHSNKGIQTGEADKAIKILKANGIEIWASYIVGFPNESRRDILETIKYARTLDTDTAQFTILTPYPGTEFWNELKDRLLAKAGKGFDGVHAIYRHPRIPPIEMQLWHLYAYIAYYLRNKASIVGFFRFLKNRKFGLEMLRQALSI